MNKGINPKIIVKRFAEKNNDVPYKNSNLCKLTGFVEDWWKQHDNSKFTLSECLRYGCCLPRELPEKSLIPYLVYRISRIPQDKRDKKDLERTLEENKEYTEFLQTPKGRKQLKNSVYNRELKENLGLIIDIETERAKWIEYYKQYYTSERTINRKAGEEVVRRFGFNPDWNKKSKSTLWRNIPKNYQKKVTGKLTVDRNKNAELHPPLFPDIMRRKNRKTKLSKNQTSVARQSYLLKRKEKVF